MLEITPHEHVVDGPGESGAGTGKVGLQFCDKPLEVLTVRQRRHLGWHPETTTTVRRSHTRPPGVQPRGDVAMRRRQTPMSPDKMAEAALSSV